MARWSRSGRSRRYDPNKYLTPVEVNQKMLFRSTATGSLKKIRILVKQQLEVEAPMATEHRTKARGLLGRRRLRHRLTVSQRTLDVCAEHVDG